MIREEIKVFLDLLPPEVLLQILQHLTLPDLAVTMADVNKRMRQLCQDPKFWTCIVLEKTWDTYTARKIVLKAGPALKELTLSRRVSNDDSCPLIILALESSPHLETLNCSYSAFYGAVMKTIGESGGSLRKISLLGHPSKAPFHRAISTDDLFSNAISLRNLTHLDIPFVSLDNHRTLDWVTAMADSCMNLQHIHLPHISPSDKVFNHFLSKVYGTLKSLKVNGFHLTDASYASLKNCHLLTELFLFGGRNLGIDGLNIITNQAVKMTELRIDLAPCASQDIADAFAGKTMGSLTRLTLAHCWWLNDTGLEMIATSCPNLEKVSILQGRLVGDCGVRSILRNCQSLTWLSLFHIDVTEKAFEHSSDSLSYLEVDEHLVDRIAKIMLPKCTVASSKGAFARACIAVRLP